MAAKGIKIRFEIDDTPIITALNKIEKESKQLQTNLKDVQKLLDLDPTNITLLAQKQEILKKSIENTSAKLKAMEEAQTSVNESYEKWQKNQDAIEQNARAIDEMTEKLKEAQESLQKMESSSNFDKTSEEYKKIKEEVSQYNTKLKELQATQKELSKNSKNLVDENTYQRYIRDTERLKINLNQLNQQQEELTQTMSEIENSSESSTQSLQEQETALQALEQAAREEAAAEEARQAELKKVKEAEEKAKQASDNYKQSLDKLKSSANLLKNDFSDITKILTAGTTAIAAGVAGATKASVETGMSFEQAMSKVQALTRANSEDMKKLEDAARQAGATTSKTATESAEALGYMALAGWSVDDMLSSLNQMIRASEAGEMELARNSDLVTDSMASLGLKSKDLAKYLDIVSYAQATSNTSMEQLLEAYVECGGMLKQLNVPLEESAALLGTLANRGIKGSEAGQAMNSILVNLIGASKTSASALKELDTSAYDSEGHFIGLSNTIKLVSDKLEKLGDDEEKINNLTAKLGGKTQLDTLQALIAGVNDEYNSLNETLSNSNGILEDTSEKLNDNLAGDIKILKSSLESVENTIYSSLDEPFREAAQNATKSIQGLNDKLGEEETAEQIRKIASALGELLDKSVEIASDDAIPAIIDFLEFLADNKDLIIASITGAGAAWSTWKIGQIVLHLLEMKKNLIETAAAQKALTIAQTETNVTTATSTLTLKDYTAALTASKGAMLGLYAAAIAVTAVIAKFIAQKIDEAGEALLAKNALDEETQAIYNQARAYEEASGKRKDEISEIERNSEKASELWEKITQLADAEGKCVGDVKELQNAISEFNAVSGQNIEIVNGQILGYEDLKKSMEEIIELDRKQAKLDYLQNDYEAAVVEVDEIKENIAATEEELKTLRETTKKAREDAKSEYEKAINDAGNGFIKVINFTSYNAAQALADEALDAEAQANVRLSSLKQMLADRQSIIDEYESIKYDYDVETSMTKEEAQRYEAEQQAQRYSQIEKDKAEKILKEKQEIQEKLQKKLEELDTQLTTRNISDEDYWKKKAEYIEKYRDEESVEWWNYFSELEEHNEKELSLQIENLKKKQEIDNSYTEEMLYNDIELLIYSLDTESELYNKYNEEIVKGRKKLNEQLEKLNNDSLKSQISSIEKELKQVESTYNSQLQSLLNKRDSYFNKIFNPSSLSNKTKQNDNEIFSLYDPEESYNKLVEFQNKFNQLQSKNVSNNIIDWINEMDQETAQDTIDVLLSMTDDKLKSYSDSFDKYRNQAELMANNKYSAQIEELNNNFVSKVDELISQLPKTASQSGQMTAQGFSQGLTEENISDSISTFTSDIINQIKKDLDINSPSRVTEQLGEYTAQGFAQGFAPEIAISAADGFVDSFINELISKEPTIQTALKNSFAFDGVSSVLSSINSIIPTLPDVSQIRIPSIEMSNIINSKDNSSNINKLISQNIDIINLLNQLLGVQQKENKFKFDIDLTGELTVDEDKLTTKIVKKINNNSLMSGRNGLYL